MKRAICKSAATDPFGCHHPVSTLAHSGTRTEKDPGAMGRGTTGNSHQLTTSKVQEGFLRRKRRGQGVGHGFGTELATFCPLCQGALPARTFVCGVWAQDGGGKYRQMDKGG